jgi:predicted nucleic acid-binding protein
MASVYVETSIFSYASARRAIDLHVQVRQDDARRWWGECAPKFDLFISQAVLDEAARGDAGAAKERLALLAGLPLIPLTDDVLRIAQELLNRHLLPPKALADAIHVAAASVGNVEYILTLNCKHIANAMMMPQIYRTLESLGVPKPLICTPQEFFADEP